MAGPRIEFLIIADYVSILSQKLYMMGGGWNRWQASQYPAQLQIGVAAGVLVPWDSITEPFAVRFSILDEDGNQISPGELIAEGRVGAPAGLKRGSEQRLIAGLNLSFPLPKQGRYEVRAGLQGTDEEEIVVFDAVLVGSP